MPRPAILEVNICVYDYNIYIYITYRMYIHIYNNINTYIL